MKPHLQDWKWAALLALVLLGVAIFAVYVVHPGFGRWYLSLLPGWFVAFPISALISKVIPIEKSLVFWDWGLIMVFNFIWYFGVSYAVIKAYRLISKRVEIPK